MEQKKITHAARLEPDNNIQVEAVKQLLYTIGSHSAERRSAFRASKGRERRSSNAQPLGF